MNVDFFPVLSIIVHSVVLSLIEVLPLPLPNYSILFLSWFYLPVSHALCLLFPPSTGSICASCLPYLISLLTICTAASYASTYYVTLSVSTPLFWLCLSSPCHVLPLSLSLLVSTYHSSTIVSNPPSPIWLYLLFATSPITCQPMSFSYLSPFCTGHLPSTVSVLMQGRYSNLSCLTFLEFVFGSILLQLQSLVLVSSIE